MKEASKQRRSYGSGARILSIGIAATGLLTFAYFSIASHVLGARQAGEIDLLWSVMFVVISVIYRPIEQLLSRTIAHRRAHGHSQHPLRVPLSIQLSFALAFLLVALVLRSEMVNGVFHGESSLFWILLAGTLAYAASYFARGWLAGHEYFALYGGLVLMEATSRVCFALAVAIGLASGQMAVAFGIAAAPILSLLVVPAAFAQTRREQSPTRAPAQPEGSLGDEMEARVATQGDGQADRFAARPGSDLSLRRGAGFAVSVSGIMLSEQTLLNAAVLTVFATSGGARIAGIVFNVLLIARAPLQLFQAIQTSLLPHLAGLEARQGHEAFAKAVRITILSIAGFAAAVAIGLLAVGPAVMEHALFGQRWSYGRLGLAIVGLGMGMHLVSGTLNQAALARDQARAAAACWIFVALAFVAWMLAPVISDELLRTEVGYLGATSVLAALLALLYRRSAAPLVAQSAATERAIA